jgi:hypothetical protein
MTRDEVRRIAANIAKLPAKPDGSQAQAVKLLAAMGAFDLETLEIGLHWLTVAPTTFGCRQSCGQKLVGYAVALATNGTRTDIT